MILYTYLSHRLNQENAGLRLYLFSPSGSECDARLARKGGRFSTGAFRENARVSVWETLSIDNTVDDDAVVL